MNEDLMKKLEVVGENKAFQDALNQVESLEGVAGGRKLFGVVTVPAVPITLVNWVFKKLY